MDFFQSRITCVMHPDCIVFGYIKNFLYIQNKKYMWYQSFLCILYKKKQ